MDKTKKSILDLGDREAARRAEGVRVSLDRKKIKRPNQIWRGIIISCGKELDIERKGAIKMANKILVTYASRAGSTAGVAEAIGKTLSEGGAQVDVIPMNDVKDLSAYQAVVAGSAIRKSQWLPEAVQFIKTHRSTLAQKPFAMFTVCITLAMSNSDQYRSAVAVWVEPVRILVKPVDEAFFAGMLDFSKLPFNLDTLMLRATVASGIFPSGDHRDWDAIHAWAEGLKPILG